MARAGKTKPAKKPAKKQPAKKQPAKKQPAKKQPAKKQPAKKPPAKKPPSAKDQTTPSDVAKLAMAGDLIGIHGALATLPVLSEPDRDWLTELELYRYLLIAADFGHDEAENQADDLREVSDTFRHDDDGIYAGSTHFKLGSDYLAGANGLPQDSARGKTHLEHARTLGYPWSVSGTSKLIAGLVAACQSPADRALVGELFSSRPARTNDDDDDDDNDDDD